MLAIFSNEYVLGGAIIAVLFSTGIVWRKTRGKFSGSDKES